MSRQQHIQATLLDIETKTDKNGQPFYKLSLAGSPHCFYAFSYNLTAETCQLLRATPEQLVNRLVLLTYQELPNKNNSGTFCQVQQMELIT